MTPKTIQSILLPLVASQRLKIRPYCWRHITLQTQDSQDSSWIYPDSLPICVLAFTEQNIQCRLPRMDSPVQLWHNSTILNYNNGQHSKLSQRVPQWHPQLGSNQQLSSWTYDPLKGREIRPDTRNFTNYMRLVRWWILEEDKNYLFSGPASFLIAF